MGPALASYLRTHRKKSGLSQCEVAELLGLNSSQTISRYESLARIPSLRTALAFQVLFGAFPHRLFPALHTDVTKLTLARLRSLLDRIADNGGHNDRRLFLLDVERQVEARQAAYDTGHTLGADGALDLF